MACVALATVGCLSINEPGSKGLSIVAEPDTTPIVIAPLSITMVAGPSSSPQGLVYTFTVRNTADTTAKVLLPQCAVITLRSGSDTTSAAVIISYPVCTAFVAAQPMQPGQSISYTKILANSYIGVGTARGDYHAWALLPVPSNSPPVSASAGVVHWGG